MSDLLQEFSMLLANGFQQPVTWASTSETFQVFVRSAPLRLLRPRRLSPEQEVPRLGHVEQLERVLRTVRRGDPIQGLQGAHQAEGTRGAVTNDLSMFCGHVSILNKCSPQLPAAVAAPEDLQVSSRSKCNMNLHTTESRPCNTQQCGVWGRWSTCSKSCEGGTRTKICEVRES